MKLPRRTFLHLTAGATALSAISRVAKGQPYPLRPVHLIVGFPAGGTGDILARLIGQWLTEHLGQPFIVENRPGASTNIAAELVVKSPPDGHTLLLATSVNAINATLFDNLNFNFIRDIAPVGGIFRGPLVMVVNPSLPVKTVLDFIAYAKSSSGNVNYASGGIGTPNHIVAELFKMRTGIDMLHVPYRGEAPALTDLLGGRVQVMFGNIPSSIELIRAGRLRALAVTTSTRSEALPDIPTVGEFVLGYEASSWQGIGASADTPDEIVSKLNDAINVGLADPNLKARLAELGGTIMPGTPGQFGALMAADTEKWGNVIRGANIRPN
jgi:tripartite-type tricarboxylate transporter receptor subunit TctC